MLQDHSQLRARMQRLLTQRDVDALGKPTCILGCTMRGIPKHRAQHRWALVRTIQSQLRDLASKRRKRVVLAGVLLAGASYIALALTHSGKPSTLSMLLALGGFAGIALVACSRLVNADASLRRICVLSHGVCASCLGALARSSASGLATCDSCSAHWDGREVHDASTNLSTMCESCGHDAERPSQACAKCGAPRRAAMGSRMHAA